MGAMERLAAERAARIVFYGPGHLPRVQKQLEREKLSPERFREARRLAKRRERARKRAS